MKAKHCSAVSIPHFRSFQQLPPTISRTWYQKHNLSQVADAELDLRAKSVFNTILPPRCCQDSGCFLPSLLPVFMLKKSPCRLRLPLACCLRKTPVARCHWMERRLRLGPGIADILLMAFESFPGAALDFAFELLHFTQLKMFTYKQVSMCSCINEK